MIALTCSFIFFLIILSGFFSGSETSLTAASRARLRMAEKDGDSKASVVLAVLEQKEKMIGSLLLGNNLVNILASALATTVMLKIFGDAGVAYATVTMTLLVLIFAEVLPKTYALHHATNMARYIAPIILVMMKILGPITQLITFIVRRTLKLFGADICLNSKLKKFSKMPPATFFHNKEFTFWIKKSDTRTSLCFANAVNLNFFFFGQRLDCI